LGRKSSWKGQRPQQETSGNGGRFGSDGVEALAKETGPQAKIDKIAAENQPRDA